jgi:hypothetical protein
MAIHVLSSNIGPDRFVFIGTTVLNTSRKINFTEQLLNDLGLKNIPIYKGEEKTARDYFPIIQSSLPTLNYSDDTFISESTDSIFSLGDS